ncbi:MAG TPA: hypothetical protein VGS96_14910 [Thermoanaerobaculia bacterium]|nr:hypothetical protein [Thermoanaerobaculia bacterium]
MRKTAFLLAIAIGVFTTAEGREGFGFSKKSITMNRTKAPALNTPARRVKVTAASDRSKEADDAATLKRYTEEVLLAGAGTLATTDKPEITIKLAVDRLDSHETWETKEETEYRKVGTKQEWNSKKNRYETKDVWDYVPVTKNVKVLKASLTGTYDILDKNGKVIDSGDLKDEFSKKYDEGKDSATPAKVEDDLMHRAATTVGARLVPTHDRVFVIVPKGSFEAYIPLAESNSWDRYLAAVQAVPENRNQSQEAYRQYALAVAKEGIAYSTDDAHRATELLREAVNHYQTAIQSNPGEKIFSEEYNSILSSRIGAPMARAQGSLAGYEAWTTGKHTGGGQPPSAVRTGEAPVVHRMTNQTLIDMAKAGLTDENLMLAIDDADDVAFDTSPNALITLAKGGVSKSVIAHMQKRAKKK